MERSSTPVHATLHPSNLAVAGRISSHGPPSSRLHNSLGLPFPPSPTISVVTIDLACLSPCPLFI